MGIGFDLSGAAHDLEGFWTDQNLQRIRGFTAGRRGAYLFWQGELWQDDPVIQTINLPEGTWQLGAVPTGGWEAKVESQVLLFRGQPGTAGFPGWHRLSGSQSSAAAEKMAVLEERQRLARDLHDSVSQVFIASVWA
jgi:signal transduction histidine kinase